ncbi:MAG: TIGR00730 family Rossman fold protein [Limosilactobacillus sp.]|uniref:LOG family protein n=1 Tax=Limosilactobacillus sp. TaxID=2773925 RepID=UPI0026FD08E9|nr:TIGR00730 family Rossman fold protein [Limosilactobacillus sp.]
MSIKRLAIFCGARNGNGKEYLVEAEKVGEWLTDHQIELVYGGGKYGLMGAVARGALLNDGVVHGVITEKLNGRGVAMEGLTSMQVTENMDKRKEKMMEMADGMIAFPGGLGTMEEIMQAASWMTVGDNTKPVAIYNFQGFYDDLKNQLFKMNQAGFLEDSFFENVYFGDNMDDILHYMEIFHAPHYRTYEK